MYSKKSNKAPLIFDMLFAFIAVSLQFNPLFSIEIYGANPMLPLCVIVTAAMFSSELYSVVFGFVIGIFADSVSSAAAGFNTVLFMFLGFAISFTAKYLFNNNIRSAITLAALASLLYFALRWLIFNGIGHLALDSFTYLYKSALPSALYTTAVAAPLYLLRKHINKKYSN